MQWADGKVATELVRARIELKLVDGPAIPTNPRGVVNANGTFVLQTYEPDDGAPAGEYRAIIAPFTPRDEDRPPPPKLLNSRFLNYATSPLTVTINPEPNQITLSVQRATAR